MSETVWICGHSSMDGGTVYAVLAARDDAERWIASKLDEQRARVERQIAFEQERGYVSGSWTFSDVERTDHRLSFDVAGMDTYFAQEWRVGSWPVLPSPAPRE